MFQTNRFIRLSFLALVNAALFFCSNCIAEDRAALLIGNESYAISPLRTPLNDVRAIGQALRRAGFSVVTVENATQKDFYERVDRFFTEHSTASVQLFFYAGHAIQLNGRNYLVPIEATLDSSDILAKMFDLRHLLERLENPRVNTRFVILDACRNNPFSGHPGASSGLSELIAPSNTYVAFSTTPGAVAFDGEGDNSPYTVSLLSSLFKPGLKLEDAFKAVRRQVRKMTNGGQTPWESSSLEQDFVMVPLRENVLPNRSAGKTARTSVGAARENAESGIAPGTAADQCAHIFAKLSLGFPLITAVEKNQLLRCK